MMVVVFGLMTLALVLGLYAPRRIAVSCLLACLAAATWLFLTDVHNRDYGFGLPWLKVDAGAPRPTGRSA